MVLHSHVSASSDKYGFPTSFRIRHPSISTPVSILPTDMTASASQGTSSAPQIRPSLYAATRLARLVLQVKERLKARVKSARQPTEPSVVYNRSNVSDRIFKDAN
jgi:hypothetical protein